MDRNEAGVLVDAIRRELDGPVNLMEVCGTHTVAFFRTGVRSLLPGEITLLSGPGCPVCVTAIEDVDRALAIAETSNTILTTFGDMMRVPGSQRSFQQARAEGADIRVVYSPGDSLTLARQRPDCRVVFFATGFETTIPSIAATVERARQEHVGNFSIYSVHKLVPPALEALLQGDECRVDGFILPGHVSAVLGVEPYRFVAERFGRPGVITGFEARDLLEGILGTVILLRRKQPRIEIQYRSVVRPEGNPAARAMIDRVFQTEDATWRGIGVIPGSGLRLRDEYSAFDALRLLHIVVDPAPEPHACACGEILRGLKLPSDCRLFGKACTPDRPVGACMVSTEGSCAAYYRFTT